MSHDQDNPRNPVLSDEMNAKGIELADRGWIDEAIRYFRKAIDLDPTSSHAWDNLAGMLAEKRAWRQALSAHLRSIELEPESAASHHNLAAFLMSFGLEIVESELREALRNDPEYPDSQLSLGLVLADMGRAGEAAQELSTAIKQDPEDAYPRHELALLLMDEGDLRSATGMLREVVRLEPENFEAHLDLGACYTRKGFFEEAKRALDNALSLRPEDPHALYGMASIHALWERKEQAVAFLRRAHEKSPDRVRAWLSEDPAFDSLRETTEIRRLLEDTQ